MKNIFDLLRVNFLGQSPAWYKLTIVSFLILNPLLYYVAGPFAAGWVVLIEFIFTLACALHCYPLQPGGLIALESLAIGLTNPQAVYHEVLVNVPTLLLLIFMVAAIYFVKDVLSLLMSKLFLVIRKKYLLSLVFCVLCACLSAFMDALTLVAVAIAVSFNFYAIYHRVEGHTNEKELEEFRGFLRNLIVHGTVGTIIGGTITIVGEPNNMMIGTMMGWSFIGFIVHCAPISLPAALSGFMVCFVLEYCQCPGFHHQMSERARELIQKDYNKKIREMTAHHFYVYAVQLVAVVLLVIALALHVAEVGLIGIGLIVLVTAFTGLTKEHDLGGAFTNAMPFTMLIVVFFAILGVVHAQHLVTPLAEWVFTFSGKAQLVALYFTNGTLSLVSDNVFIATVFIGEVENHFQNAAANVLMPEILQELKEGANWQDKIIILENAVANGLITDELRKMFIGFIELPDKLPAIENAFSRGVISEGFKDDLTRLIGLRDQLAVVVNMGTNIPAMATPNGHAALLFLLTSSLAPLLHLSYFRMLKLALPYTIVMTITGALAIYFFL